MKEPFLQIEKLKGANMLNIKMNNMPEVARMLRIAMEERPEIAAAFISATVHYLEDKKIPYEAMKEMYVPP